MKAVNCLQDLKAQLIDAGFEIEESMGWYVITAHGRWTMALGDVFLNGVIIQKITDAVVLKKSVKSKKVKTEESIKPKAPPPVKVIEEKPKVEETTLPAKPLETKSILEKYKKLAKKKNNSKKT